MLSSSIHDHTYLDRSPSALTPSPHPSIPQQMHWIVVDLWSSFSQSHPAPSCLPNQAFQAPPTAAKGAVRSAPAGMLTHTIDKAGWIIIPGSLPPRTTEECLAERLAGPSTTGPVPDSPIQNPERTPRRPRRPVTPHHPCLVSPHRESGTSYQSRVVRVGTRATSCCVCCGAVVRGTASNSTAQPGTS